MQKAFVDYHAFQCGYCTSGFLMVCHSLWMMKSDADEEEMEDWLQSNICRDTSYKEIRHAMESVLTTGLYGKRSGCKTVKTQLQSS